MRNINVCTSQSKTKKKKEFEFINHFKKKKNKINQFFDCLFTFRKFCKYLLLMFRMFATFNFIFVY